MKKHKATHDKQIVMASTDRPNKPNTNKNLIVNELKELLECNDTEASELYYNHVNSVDELGWAKENIEFLLEISVSRIAIRRHGSILTIPFGEFGTFSASILNFLFILLIQTHFPDQIEKNAKIIMEMKPKHIDDFIPLISVETSVLETYKCSLKTANIDTNSSNHPIYYFSERLNVRTPSSPHFHSKLKIVKKSHIQMILFSDSRR